MSTVPEPRPPVSCRRAARRLAYWNGAVWAIGNGLTSGTLVIYLARELGVPGMGLGIGMIRAAPRIAGLLRVAAPALIARLGGRKRFCLGAYLASGLVLLGLPPAAAPGWLPSPSASLAALVLLWCLYHLLEYLGSVALWSWLADLAPQRVRGRFFGQRQRWMVAGQAAAMLDAGLFSWGWHAMHPGLPRWIGYAIPAALGAWFIIAAVVPLVRMPSFEGRGGGGADRIDPQESRAASRKSEPGRVGPEGPGRRAPARKDVQGATLPWMRKVFTPLADPRFRRLILFGCWFSFFNGLTQSVQALYPMSVLGMSLFVMLSVETGMRIGQLGLSPWFGRMADRLGNRPVMMASLVLTAGGMLFYFFSTPERPWWFAGAWVMWIAYAGLNIGLPSLTLRLAPRESNAAYVAAFDAASGLCLAAGSLLGGMLYDHLGRYLFVFLGGAVVLDFFHLSFLYGWITRTMGVLVLWLVIEPRRGRPTQVP
jgi:MFS family permease